MKTTYQMKKLNVMRKLCC